MCDATARATPAAAALLAVVERALQAQADASDPIVDDDNNDDTTAAAASGVDGDDRLTRLAQCSALTRYVASITTCVSDLTHVHE
jgi:hypothetical protein